MAKNLFKKVVMCCGGGGNFLNRLQPKQGLLFTVIFCLAAISLQAQTTPKTLKLFMPPTGTVADSVLLWHPADSGVYAISASALAGGGSGDTATTAWYVGAPVSNTAALTAANATAANRTGIISLTMFI